MIVFCYNGGEDVMVGFFKIIGNVLGFEVNCNVFYVVDLFIFKGNGKE